MTARGKFDQQEGLYAFPYHYIPSFDAKGRVSLQRRLSWGIEYLCYQLHVKEVIEALNPESVLEVGCGDGYLIGSLRQKISRRLGVDLSERAIRFAKAFHPGCEFAVADAAELSDTFDVVAAIEVLEHVPDDGVSAFIRGLEARLKPAGALIVSVPTTVLPLNRKHYRHYDISLFRQQLASSGAKLEIERVEYVYRPPGWMRAFSVFSENPLYCIEIKPLMGWVWRHIWTRCRLGTERDAHHMVVHLRRSTATTP